MTNIMRLRVASDGWAGSPGLSTFYFRAFGLTVLNAGDATDVLARVRAAYVGSAGLYTTNVTFRFDPLLDVLDAESGTLLGVFAGTPVADVTGSGGTNMDPVAAAICVSWRTADIENGRRVRGRTFLSPLASNGDGNGTPSADQLGAAQQFGDQIVALDPGDAQLAVWHRPVDGAGGSANVVTAVTVRDVFAVLTSRRD